MNVKNMIIENDYEFSLSEIKAAFFSFSLLSTVSASSSNSSISSHSSHKDNSIHFQSQQYDIIKICVLLFDTYKSMCFLSGEDKNSQPISRQSARESLLPGLSCLKEIFHDSIIIHSGSSGQNDYVKSLDAMIHKIEAEMNENSSENSSPNSKNSQLSPSLTLKEINSEIKTPVKVSAGSLIGEIVNKGTSALSSSSASSASSASTVTSMNLNPVTETPNPNANFKSFVFKDLCTQIN
ncbi:hypothetical protein BpHYR1_051497, partial [Brachionus plicatilis]